MQTTLTVGNTSAGNVELEAQSNPSSSPDCWCSFSNQQSYERFALGSGKVCRNYIYVFKGLMPYLILCM